MKLLSDSPLYQVRLTTRNKEKIGLTNFSWSFLPEEVCTVAEKSCREAFKITFPAFATVFKVLLRQVWRESANCWDANVNLPGIGFSAFQCTSIDKVSSTVQNGKHGKDQVCFEICPLYPAFVFFIALFLNIKSFLQDAHMCHVKSWHNFGSERFMKY